MREGDRILINKGIEKGHDHRPHRGAAAQASTSSKISTVNRVNCRVAVHWPILDDIRPAGPDARVEAVERDACHLVAVGGVVDDEVQRCGEVRSEDVVESCGVGWSTRSTAGRWTTVHNGDEDRGAGRIHAIVDSDQRVRVCQVGAKSDARSVVHADFDHRPRREVEQYVMVVVLPALGSAY